MKTNISNRWPWRWVAGLLVAFLGRLLNLQIPFVAMMLFVALVIFGFDRIWRTIKKRSTQ